MRRLNVLLSILAALLVLAVPVQAARDFEGAGNNDYVSAASLPVTTTPCTFACRFRPDTVANTVFLSLCKSSADGDHISIGLTAGGAVKAAVNAGGSASSASTTANATTGVWYHAVAVFASSTSRTAYLNGGNSATDTTSLAPSGLNTLSIGARRDLTPDQGFDGRIEDVTIFDVALTADEALSLANGADPRSVRPGHCVSFVPLSGRTTELDLISGQAWTPAGTCPFIDAPPFVAGGWGR